VASNIPIIGKNYIPMTWRFRMRDFQIRTFMHL